MSLSKTCVAAQNISCSSQVDILVQLSRACLRDLRPSGLSKLLSDRSTPDAARRSPRVRAPRDCSRRATAAAKRCSPPRLVIASLYTGALTWQQESHRHTGVPSLVLSNSSAPDWGPCILSVQNHLTGREHVSDASYVWALQIHGLLLSDHCGYSSCSDQYPLLLCLRQSFIAFVPSSLAVQVAGLLGPFMCVAPTWFDLWLRPSCWMALSALHGSSQVKWTRRR